MEKKNIDWENLSFSYQAIDQRYVADYVDGAWQPGHLSSDPMITMSECAGVLQYSQSVFEGLKAYNEGWSYRLFSAGFECRTHV